MCICMCQLVGGVFDEKYVRSCRVRTARSLRGLCLSPAISRAERREVERLLVDALDGLSGDLAGTYYPLSKMTQEQESQLIAVSNIAKSCIPSSTDAPAAFIYEIASYTTWKPFILYISTCLCIHIYMYIENSNISEIRHS